MDWYLSKKYGTSKGTLQSHRHVLRAHANPLLKSRLKGDRAINKIDIDFMTDSVIVEYDSNLITRKKIKEKLENSGYKFIRVAT